MCIALLLCFSSFQLVYSFSTISPKTTYPYCQQSVKGAKSPTSITPSSLDNLSPRIKTKLQSTPNDDDENNDAGIFSRFTSPQIDDAGLPIADSLLSQIVAPTMQITWLSIVHAPIPSWLYSASSTTNGMLFQSSSTQGGLLIVPTLIHGAGLTLCWVLGCLAAKNYESDAFNISGGRGYKTVILRLVQSGSFAVGLLILSTQIDLLLEYGRYVQPGESDEIDFRLLNAIVEVINDIVFEAGVLSAWRIYRASLTGSADGRPPNYKP